MNELLSAPLKSVRDIAERLARALRETGVFVFDRGLVDQPTVSRLLGVAGVDQFLTRQTISDMVVYVIRTDVVEARCRRSVCNEVPPEEARACVAECFHKTLKEMVEVVAKNILEAAESME